MSNEQNYLLGYGERLTEPIEIIGGGTKKKPPYSFEEARSRIVPMMEAAVATLDAIPERACPRGEAVVSLILHPEYLAKSYFPGGLLRASGLRNIGSRARTIRPQQRSLDREPQLAVTTELFVAGTRSSFHRLGDQVPHWTPKSPGANQLPAIERVSVPSAEERIRPLSPGEGAAPIEVVLHASENRSDRFILAAFQEFAEDLDLEPDLDHIFFAGKLCFLRLRATATQAREVAQFSFLRVLRDMPKLRTINPVLRSLPKVSKATALPNQDVLDPHLRVALLDGGLPDNSPLASWVNAIEGPNIGASDPDCLWHGETVTSAMLFGSIAGGLADQALCRIDHHRVLDEHSQDDPFELYAVLERVKSILDQGNYEFFNLSVGPTLAVDDDDVHAWTAVLDEYLSDGRSLATIAAGNTGMEPEDPVLQQWRIQVPSDCVNGLTVGASDRLTPDWERASYSSMGPGRSPGIVKPDVVSFGGSHYEPFWVMDPNVRGKKISVAGTSYAAPAAIRSGLAIRAHLGTVLSPLAIKALLIHSAESSSHPRNEVGWGRLPTNLDDFLVCPEGSFRVVYQDEITPAHYRRVHVPLPNQGVTGKVHITATFCFATSTDPEHPSNYTKSGLSVVFRPNRSKFKEPGGVHATTAPFFRPATLYRTEQQLRQDAHKWETCLHARVSKLAKGLEGPVFDIHHNARSGGRDDLNAERIRYALVLTVETPKVKDIYDQVVRTFRTQIQPLTPIIRVPVRSTPG